MTTPPSSDDRHVRRLARGSALSVTGAAIGGITSIGIVAAVTNLVSLNTAGVLFAMTSMFLIGVSIATLGVETGLTRFVSAAMAEPSPPRARATVRSGIAGVLVSSTMVALIAWALAVPLGVLTATSLGGEQTATRIIRIMSLAIVPAVLAAALSAAARGYRTMRVTIAVDQSRAVLQFLLVLVVAIRGGSATALATAWCVPYAVAAVAAGIGYRRIALRHGGRHVAVPRALQREVTRDLWRFTVPRAPTRVTQAALQRVDVILIATIASPSAAAVYTAASRVVALGQIAGQAVPAAMQAVLSRVLALGDQVAALKVFQRCTTWTVALTWPLCIGVASAPVLYLTLFGSDYSDSREAVAVAMILSITMLFTSTTGPLDVALLMAGRSGLSLANNAVALALDVALCLVLVPWIGIVGAAIAWAAAIGARNIIPIIQVKKLVGLHSDKVEMRLVALGALLCIGIPGVVGSVVRPPALVWLGAMVLGGCLYLALLWRWRGRLGIRTDFFTSSQSLVTGNGS